MGLNVQQKKAVEYLGGPLLVLAGPGTGKTQLLSEKVAYILQNTDTSASNILCLTFTDTGAKNMRERLKTIIGRDALKVNIGTYHAFGQEILAQYKVYAVDYDRRLDAAIDEVRQFKIVREIQTQLPGTDILRGDSVKDIISVISEAKAARLTAGDLALIAKQNIEDSEVLSRAISPYLKQVVPRKLHPSLEEAYQPIYEILKGHEEMPVLTKNIERSIVWLARGLKEAMLVALEKDSVAPLNKWRDDCFEKTDAGDYRLKDRVANRKLASIAVVYQRYDDYLREEGWFDFDDMIEEAVLALKKDAGFRMTLQEKYQFIMLDEFQDTNPSQFAIVKALTDYERPMIMAVGDDDQAIYEFQGAKSSNLTDFQEYYGAEVIPLVENYRSTQEILDFSRQIINQADDRFADKELVAHKAVPAKSQIYRYEFNSSDAEYGFIAKEIANLVKNGVKQSEIAVISYKSKYFEPLLPYLKAEEGIKIAYEKRDNLFEDARMRQIFMLARYIVELAREKRPTVQLMEILAYPFFGLDILEVVRLIGAARTLHKPTFDYLAENGGDQLRAVLGFIAEMAGATFTEPLGVMLDYLIGVAARSDYCSPFLKYYTEVEPVRSACVSSDNRGDDARAYATFVLYENLAALRGKLLRHFGDKNLKLTDLVEMLDDYEAAEMPMNTTSPYRDADEAVQILTAHKAKGLEFEYVFIVSADHTAWGKGKGNNNLLVLPRNLMQIRHTGTTDGEKLRVLYVALTRAKGTLYITNSLHDFNGKSPERLEYLEERVEKDASGRERIISPFLPSGEVVQRLEAGTPAEREANVRSWLMPYLLQAPDMRQFYRERMGGFRMSASALTTFVDVIHKGPQTFFERYVLNAPNESESEALIFGNLVHTTFEAVTKTGLDTEAAMEYFLSELDAVEAAPELKKSLADKGRASIAATMQTFGEVLRQGEAELNFSAEKLVVDGVPVTGKIDHLVVDEKNKTIEVYDFKTSTYHAEKWKSHPVLYEYMLQLLFYKMLLNNSVKYRNYKVVRGHILFVVKDKHDEMVHDRVYDYDAEDEAEFRKLLAAVYAEATSLGFLDEPELFVAADKNRNVKAMREFIALLLDKHTEK